MTSAHVGMMDGVRQPWHHLRWVRGWRLWLGHLKDGLRPLGTVAALLCVFVCAYGLTQHREVMATIVFEDAMEIWPALLGGLGFVGFRGWALQQAAQRAGLTMNRRQGVRAFVEGVAIESITWPGKVWADIYRASYPQQGNLRQRMEMMIRFRAGMMLATGLLIVIALALPLGLLVTMLSLLLLVVMWVVLRNKHALWMKGSTRIVGLSLLAGVSDVFCISVIVQVMTGVSALDFALWYLLLGVLAAGSTLPQGLGLLDLGGWWILTQWFAVDASLAGAVMVTYRIVGPTLTLLMGACGLLERSTRGWKLSTFCLTWTTRSTARDTSTLEGGYVL